MRQHTSHRHSAHDTGKDIIGWLIVLAIAIAGGLLTMLTMLLVGHQ
ncbi:MAG: hypothetical protein PHR30_12585 [Gallionellaceae bacterium]|nr:hypothetical protein [Gallionellaceae bacterium]MDD5366169.1 hypothetical protein [Gallionellaceae bacterium]